MLIRSWQAMEIACVFGVCMLIINGFQRQIIILSVRAMMNELGDRNC